MNASQPPLRPAAPVGAAARQALVEAALEAFGRQGFDSATTRAIAGAAGMPMSQITYHFGGKEGLYLACAQFIADYAAGQIGPVMQAVAADMAAQGAAPPPQRAREGLRRLLCGVAEAILAPRARHFARFVLREQAEPTAAFAVLYNAIMGPLLGLVAQLLAQAGVATGAEARLRSLALVGQVLVFRTGHAAVMAFTGWDEIGPDELAAIQHTIAAHVAALTGPLGREAEQ